MAEPVARRSQRIGFAKSAGSQIQRPLAFVHGDDVFGTDIARVALRRLTARSNDPGSGDETHVGGSCRRTAIQSRYPLTRIVREQHFDLRPRKAIPGLERAEPGELFAHSRKDLIAGDGIRDERSHEPNVQPDCRRVGIYGLVSAGQHQKKQSESMTQDQLYSNMKLRILPLT
jgi:hypothetical protein